MTRWHESPIYPGLPKTDPLREGVLDLTLINKGKTWIEVSRAVFVNTGMTIWYGDYVLMSARMELYSNMVAETKILSTPGKNGMTRSISAYSARKVPVVEVVPEKVEFLMEFGLGDKIADN